MSNSLVTPAPHNEASLFPNRDRHRTAKTIASLAIAGLLLACAPAQAVEAVPDEAPSAATCSSVGTIWWSELLAPETEKLTEFYSKVIGWKVKVVDAEDHTLPPRTPDDRYTTFSNGVEEVAGLMKANHPVAAHSGLGWFTYIEVADVEETIEKVEASGGTVLREPVETENGDEIAVISDPMGNVFGIVTPAERAGC